MDRVVDLQFGSNEAAYHIIIELYDRVSQILYHHQCILYIVNGGSDIHVCRVMIAVRKSDSSMLGRPIELTISLHKFIAIELGKYVYRLCVLLPIFS